MKRIYKLFGIKRLWFDWYQHKTSEGKYINTYGCAFLIKGVHINGAKVKAIFKDDKILAIKYLFGCFKDICKNTIYIKKLEHKNIIFE